MARDLIHDSMTPEHQREATTPIEDGTLLADCSCGGTYSVPQGGDEYAALEEAHVRHAAEALTDEERRAIRALQRLAKRWPKSLTLFSWSGSLVVFHSADMTRLTSCYEGGEKSDLILDTVEGIPNDGGDP
jgi:hypothetical protein